MKIVNFNAQRLRYAVARLLGITGDGHGMLSDADFSGAIRDREMLEIAADYETVWSMAEALESDSGVAAELAECDRLLCEKNSRTVSRVRKTAVAATLACLTLLGAMFYGYTLLPAVYSTALGEQRLVVLQDGSRITLNTESEIAVRYGDERRIELNKGEAYFDVAPDPEHPFVVKTPSGRATVLGTEFSVRLDNESTIVTVVEGLVEVSTRRRQQTIPPALSAGESLTLLDSGAVTPKERVDTTPITYWREGKIYFQDQRLDTSVAEFNRYLERKLVIGNRELKDLRIAGVFRISDVDAFLFALEEAFNIETIETGNSIMLIKKPGQPG